MAYILEYIMISGFFVSAYWLIFRQETHHGMNRGYLLITLLVSLLMPFLPSVFPQMMSEGMMTVLLPFVEVGQSPINFEETAVYDTSWIIPTLWALGSLVVLSRTILGVYKISQIQGEKIHVDTQEVILTKENLPPFSFFSKIFLPLNHKYDEKQLRQVVLHESSHARLGHTLDLMFMHVIQVITWWNPFNILYKSFLRETHEYQADAYVIHSEDPKDYSRFLLSNVQSLPTFSLAHHLFSQPLKQRIIMMQKHLNTQPNLIKYLLILPIIALSLVLHSCKDEVVEASDVKVDETYEVQSKDTIISFDPATNKESMKIVDANKTVYKVADEMPRFPGCEDLTGDERSKCASKNLLKYIYTQVKYPVEAKEEGLEGTVICKFVVSSTGFVENIEIVKDPGAGLGKEVQRVVRKMADEQEWVPGQHDGKPVHVAFTLPVKFKLE